MGLTILHTADWHLGKRLYEYDLVEAHHQFLNWLTQLVKSQKPDYLLISGDVFDLANPSTESLRLYYEFLRSMISSSCKIIITGGNHDSAGLLNAPAALLKEMQIQVFGSATEKPEDLLVPLHNQSGEIEAIVAAVPFLRDKDLRKSVDIHQAGDRVEAVRKGIKLWYEILAMKSAELYQGIPLLGMGHLFVQNAELSDSEREIQIGNQASFDLSEFPEDYVYMALGHIHRPQRFGKNGQIRYSGAPIPLSFSEKGQRKQLEKIELNMDGISMESIAIPSFFSLEIISGTFSEVLHKIDLLKNTQTEKQGRVLVEIQIIEKKYDPNVLRNKDELIASINTFDYIKVVNSKVAFMDQPNIEGFDESAQLNVRALSPLVVFDKLVENYSDSEKNTLIQAFAELLETVEIEG
ncbi:MAG: exonuclease subunit SbcD [Cyclobacteriaceae bacterium]